MTFTEFSQQLEELEGKDSRLEMMYQLAELFESFESDEVVKASYLMQGSLVPAYVSLEFQLSVKMLVRSLASLHIESQDNDGSSESTAVGLFGDVDDSAAIDAVTKQYKKAGDIGTVAQEIVEKWRSSQNITVNTNVSILEVFDSLVEIAEESGSGSQEAKLKKLTGLFKQVTPVSAKYIARIIIGKLRLGFSAMTMLDALSWAALESKDHRSVLESAYQKKADVGELAKVYLELAKKYSDDPQKLAVELEKKYEVTTGIPVVPALCQRLNTAQEIIEKMGTVYAEPKYDGLRIQVHYKESGFPNGEKVKAYTRNLEDVSHMFPELSEFAEQLKTDECILDAEAIGYDPETDKLLPFQETITRKRKHKVSEAAETTPIRFFVFDVLSSGNKSFLDKELRERKELLKDLFNENRTIKLTKYIETSDPTELHNFHELQLEHGLEGAVIKQIDSNYQSGRKGWGWVKIKESEGSSGKLKDTLDVVVMGYYYGRGKRSDFGIGAFLVGVLNEKQEVKTIAKIGTGLSDEQFKELKKRSDALEVDQQPKQYEVHKSLIPDVWMQPELVVEVAADELTKSPNHSAKQALRFPRLVKFRDDKNWTDATTISELANL